MEGDKMRNKILVSVCLIFLCGLLLFLEVIYKEVASENKQNIQDDEKIDENLSNNVVLGGELAEENGKIYFSNADDGWCLYVKSVEGGEENKLNSERSDNINIGDGWLFYRDVKNHRIIKMNMDGSEKNIIYNGIIDNLIYNKGYLYFLEENEGKQCITKIGCDGNKKEKIFSDSIYNLILKNDWFYYYSTEDKMIKKVKMNGSSSCCVFKSEVDFFVVNDSGIYFTDKEKQKICCVDFDGSSVSVMVNSYSDCINISDGWIYYSIINDCIWRKKIGINITEKYVDNNILRFYITDNALLYDYIKETDSGEKICQGLMIK